MVRSFDSRPVPDDVLARVLHAAQRAPSAGFSQGVEFLLLAGPEETGRYWDISLPAPERAHFPFPGLITAPVIVLPCARPQVYVDRYSLPDKAGTGLDTREAWPVPYWTVDAAFAAENLLLACVDEGLGALFFGMFDAGAAVRAEFGIPDDAEPIGTIALGYPAPDDRPTGSSVKRRRRPPDEVVHRGRW